MGDPLDETAAEGTHEHATEFLADLISYNEFVAKHRSKSREDFLEAVATPHLLVTSVATSTNPDAQNLGVVTLRGTPEEMREVDGRVVILPLTKRPGSNSFIYMITLGRADNNDLVLAHPMISKFHAYFRQVGDRWTICDANSSNGTSVDGRRLPPERQQPVETGSRIQLGTAVSVEFIEPAELYESVSRG